VGPLPGGGPQCSGYSAGTVLELACKSSTLCAAEAMVARCPFGCRPELRGPWIPAFAGKTMREISASSEPFRFPCESRGPGAAVAPLPRGGPQRSRPSAGTVQVLMKRKHPLCCRNHGGSMSFWLPPSAPWSLDPGPGYSAGAGKRGAGKRGPRWCGCAEWTSVQRAFAWHLVASGSRPSLGKL